jgi:hypothetical protein
MQPASNSNPELKKQPKTNREKIAKQILFCQNKNRNKSEIGY